MIHDANGAALEWDDFCPPRNHYLLRCRTFHLQFAHDKCRLLKSSNTPPYCKESQLKNRDISGALYTLRIQYSYTQTQCEDGARDVMVL